MKWFNVLLCSYQPEPFMVQADNMDTAMMKTVNWAVVEYPGIIKLKGGLPVVEEKGFPLISIVEEEQWN